MFSWQPLGMINNSKFVIITLLLQFQFVWLIVLVNNWLMHLEDDNDNSPSSHLAHFELGLPTLCFYLYDFLISDFLNKRISKLNGWKSWTWSNFAYGQQALSTSPYDLNLFVKLGYWIAGLDNYLFDLELCFALLS